MFLNTFNNLVIVCVVGLAILVTKLLWIRISLKWLQNLTYLLVLSLPFERIPSLAVSGVNIRISQVLIIIGFYFLIILLTRGDNTLSKLKISSFSKWFLAFWVALIPSLFFAINPLRQIQILIATFLVFAATFLISNFITKPNQAIRHLCLILSGVGIFGIYQFIADFVGFSPALTLLREQYTKKIFGFARVHATALEPLYWGGMLLLPIIYFTTQLINKTSTEKLNLKKVIIDAGCLIICLINLALTLSRGAYLAMAVSFLVILILQVKNLDQKKLKLVFTPFISIVGVIVILFALNAGTYQKQLETAFDHVTNVFTSNQTSTVERLNFLSDALNLLPYYLVTGIGSGNYGPYVQHNKTQADGSWLITNNVYVEIILEQGILALLIFCWMLLQYIIKAIKKIGIFKNKLDLQSQTNLGVLVAALIGYLVQWTTFSPIFIMPIFIILGLIIRFIEIED